MVIKETYYIISDGMKSQCHYHKGMGGLPKSTAGSALNALHACGAIRKVRKGREKPDPACVSRVLEQCIANCRNDGAMSCAACSELYTECVNQCTGRRKFSL
jgi:hypothetical protein